MFKKIVKYGHEQVVFAYDEDTGLKAIIGIHSTVLGPALGGTRMWDYKSEEDAIYDVLRLSRGMTLKNSAAGLNLGGGKAVIIGNPAKLKNEKFLISYGKFVNSLNGSYITAEDVNIGVSDIEIIRKSTKYVAGINGENKSGNPSPFTARGVLRGMEAITDEKFGTKSLKGLTVAIQGLGSVGYELCRLLNKAGAKLIVTDINPVVVNKAQVEFGAKVVSSKEILTVKCDIFAPCALGSVISVDNVSSLNCKIIAGAANNVLVNDAAGNELVKYGISYIPDYIINAGGVINIAMELDGDYSAEKATRKVDNIYNNVKNLLSFAEAESLPTHLAADKFAMERINKVKK